jgi:hypothetical protein
MTPEKGIVAAVSIMIVRVIAFFTSSLYEDTGKDSTWGRNIYRADHSACEVDVYGLIINECECKITA